MTKKFDIHDRIFEFIVSVITLAKLLPRNPENIIIINQLVRSVTSMGANDQEADGASTKKDFIHCYTLVRKEGKETIFWLKLIKRLNQSTGSKIDDIIDEGNQIVAIISTILKNSNKNI